MSDHLHLKVPLHSQALAHLPLHTLPIMGLAPATEEGIFGKPCA
jgi:hypothetical protein